MNTKLLILSILVVLSFTLRDDPKYWQSANTNK